MGAFDVDATRAHSDKLIGPSVWQLAVMPLIADAYKMQVVTRTWKMRKRLKIKWMSFAATALEISVRRLQFGKVSPKRFLAFCR